MQTSTFHKKVWTSISDELFAEMGKRVIVQKLKSKFNRLRKKHREFSYLIKHTGFGWDPVANTVTSSNEVWADYIKKCIGAIDGTHVAAWPPARKQTSYCGRKVVISQNVMCACNFDKMFTFVYTGWEDIANDSRVFVDVLRREENQFPFPNEGYSNMSGFLAPYRGERYHLRDYRGSTRAPRGPTELFTYIHSSLRNVIERYFSVLKARFPILKLMPNYLPRRQ
ncbi:hypothetical protein Dsin_022115 [Dipteronia sinensis]|uniref:Myb/SANT-like domain-containing protein n=1 Tax=Dipteronia sinensis TaxID=43782 RepID=A0AAE0DZF1_9ROSI|nr:hypothetical protein Dsin_022115 [Dipteronia sinensis]